MYHSLIITKNGSESVNTWDDWYLIPTSMPVVSMPTMTTSYVDIPGRDGSIDLSDYLVGRPTYSDRSGTFEFIVVPEHGDLETRRTQIAAFLDGSKVTMKLEDDQGYYYEGRMRLSSWSNSDQMSRASIEYRFRPYKIRISDGRAVL